MFTKRHLAGLVTAAAVTVSLVGCSAASTPAASVAPVNAATATSAQAFGGLADLVKAAKKEGALNVIALPNDWANYGAIKAAFAKKYGITVNSASPDVSSAEEITAAKNLKGQDTAPDVFDLGAAVTLSSTEYFAPYKVANWKDIPAANKEASGLHVNDYTGSMSIGYDSTKLPKPTSVADLLKPAYKGAVALNGDPTQAGAAFAAIGLLSVQNGGSLDDFKPGIDFITKLNKAGNFIPVDASPQTIASGETKLVFDWSYNNLAQSAVVPGWKVTTLPGTAYTSYYNQAINKDAPHPAAARLWQEYIFSAEGQNAFLVGGAYPVTIEALTASGKIDKKALDTLGKLDKQVTPTDAQAAKGAALLAASWATAIG